MSFRQRPNMNVIWLWVLALLGVANCRFRLRFQLGDTGRFVAVGFLDPLTQYLDLQISSSIPVNFESA